MRGGAHRFLLEWESGSILEQERAKRTTSYDGLTRARVECPVFREGSWLGEVKSPVDITRSDKLHLRKYGTDRAGRR